MVDLNVIEFDHPFSVDEHGNVNDDIPGIYSPSVMDEELDSEEWEFFSAGYTGQYGYNGPIMHNSEVMGGQLAKDVLAEPGIYAMVPACYSSEDEDEEFIWEGWAVVKMCE